MKKMITGNRNISDKNSKIDTDPSFGFKSVMFSLVESSRVATIFLVSLILSRIFTKTDYASYSQALLVYAFSAPFLTLGLSQTLYYFLRQNNDKARSILSGNLFVLFMSGLVFMLIIWCGANNFFAKRFGNPGLGRLLLVYSFYGISALPTTAISACLVYAHKIKTLIIYNILTNFIVVCCVVSLAFIWHTPYMALLGIVIAGAIISFAAIFLMYKIINKGPWRPTLENIRTQLKCSIPLGLAGSIGIISLSIGKILVSSMRTPEEFAVYVNGAMEIPMIGIVVGSIIAMLIPELSQMYQRKEITNVISLWKKTTVKCASFLFPIMIVLFVMAPEIIRILFSSKYEGSIIPFKIYLFLIPLRIMVYGAILTSIGKSAYITYLSLTMLFLSTILITLLIPFMGINGAALGLVISSYIVSICYLILITKILQKPIKEIFPWVELSKIIAASIIPSGIIIFSRFFPSSDILRLSIFLLTYAAILLITFKAFDLTNPMQIIYNLRRLK